VKSAARRSGGVQVALLRGINVGKAKRVAMADLRALAESLGYTNVRTLLNSGNVVFVSKKHSPGEAALRLEQGIAKTLGVESRVTVLTGEELDAIVSENPLLRVAKNPSRLLVTVLTDPKDRSRLQPLLKEKWKPEAFALGARVAYLWCPDSILDSRLGASVNKVLGAGATARNWATVLKLQALAAELAGLSEKTPGR